MLRFNASCRNDIQQIGSASYSSVPSNIEISQKIREATVSVAASDHPSFMHPLVKKLSSLVQLGADEGEAVRATAHNVGQRSAGDVLYHEDSRPDQLYVILEGIAYRYKLLADGRRQILGYLLPGDHCDMQFILFNQPDHSLALLTDGQIASIPLARLAELSRSYPRIDRAMMLAALLDRAILRQWLLNIGQRNALQRIAHFFCEIHWRMNAVGGVADDGSIALPINQYALADTVGMTPVHVNRTLQRLREEKLILLCHRRLKILDHSSLAQKAGFNPQYMRVLYRSD